ncbi:MAG: hypothetical protein QOD00_2378, partial [Blastocatellia bacterium]|nr:hypothetical protein [Blastocatellia bacterium]
TIYVARNNRAAKDEMVKDERGRRGLVPQLAIEERGPDAPATQIVQDVPATNARDAGNTMQSTHAALAGFKPAGEVKLRIIKGTYRDEK